MLDAAMERQYSGNPGEGFFTGGGLHHFGNFSKLDDSRILSVREALRSAVTAFGLPGRSVELASPATPEAVFWALDAARQTNPAPPVAADD